MAELIDAECPGATFGRDRVGEARAAAHRLGRFTVSELADELGANVDSVRRFVASLRREGTIVVAGTRAARAARGPRHRVYRIEPGGRARTSAAEPRRISPKTINNSLIPLRLALAHAVEDGLIAANPAASAPGARRRIKIAAEHREMDFLRLNEIPRYLDACSTAYRPLAEVLVVCGLRISEALHLTWTDVDVDGLVILVTGSRKRGRERAETSGSTKGDRSRAVEFGPRTAGMLRDLRAREAEHRSADLRSRPVFATADGRRLSRNTVSRGWHKAALRDAGLRETLRLHDLRHTAAASWLAAGLPLIYVQRQLGHASITTTEAQYGHLEKGFLRGAAKRAEAARLGGASRGARRGVRLSVCYHACYHATNSERYRSPAPNEEARRVRGFPVRPGRLELPRTIRSTRPSTLRVYQFRHRRVAADYRAGSDPVRRGG